MTNKKLTDEIYKLVLNGKHKPSREYYLFKYIFYNKRFHSIEISFSERIMLSLAKEEDPEFSGYYGGPLGVYVYFEKQSGELCLTFTLPRTPDFYDDDEDYPYDINADIRIFFKSGQIDCDIRHDT